MTTSSAVHTGTDQATAKEITARFDLHLPHDVTSTAWFQIETTVVAPAGLTFHRLVNHTHTMFVDGMTVVEVDDWLQSNRSALNSVAAWNRKRKDLLDEEAS